MKSLIFFLLATALGIVLLNFTGCIPTKPLEEVEILPADRLVKKLEVNRRRIKNFEGTGTIQIRTKELNNSAAFRVVMQKPDSIYFTIMGPFGIELAQAVISKKEFTLYDALSNTVYKGLISDEILYDVFKINLPLGELMDAFTGSINLTEKLYTQPASYEVVYDKYILSYKDSLNGYTTKFTVDVRELGITDYLLAGKSGNILLEGKYSKFILLENVAVPMAISLENKKNNQRLNIEYKSMEANKNNIVIDFQIPSDAAIVKW